MSIYSCYECNDAAYQHLHNSLKNKFMMTAKECQTLYDLIKDDYIHYDNQAAHDLIRRVMQFLKESKQ